MNSITSVRCVQAFFSVSVLLSLIVLETKATTVTPQQDGNITSTSSSSTCFQKSTNFSDVAAAGLTCDELNYTDQYCFVKNESDWSCLEKRASVQNFDTCRCYDDERYLTCPYVEICAFPSDTFSCQEEYNCTIVEFGCMRCLINGKYEDFNCTHSLIYNPEKELSLQGTVDVFKDIFKDDCLDKYEGDLNKDVMWFYIDRTVFDFNDTKRSYSKMRSVSRGDTTDPSRLCSYERVEPDMTWKYAVVIVAVVLCLALGGFVFWRCKRYSKAHEKILNLGAEQCKERQNFIFSDEENHENDSSSKVHEKFEEVPLECITITENGDASVTRNENSSPEFHNTQTPEVTPEITTYHNRTYTGEGGPINHAEDHNLTGSSLDTEANSSHMESNTDTVENPTTMSNGANANNEDGTTSSNGALSPSTMQAGYWTKDSSTKSSTLHNKPISSSSHNATGADGPKHSPVLGEYVTKSLEPTSDAAASAIQANEVNMENPTYHENHSIQM